MPSSTRRTCIDLGLDTVHMVSVRSMQVCKYGASERRSREVGYAAPYRLDVRQPGGTHVDFKSGQSCLCLIAEFGLGFKTGCPV